MKRFALSGLGLAAVSLALMPPQAVAADARMGQGSDSCAQYVDAYNSDPLLAEYIYFTWAQGFMSGLNMQALLDSGEALDVSSRTMETKERALRDYCVQHPTHNFSQAVLSLYYSFKKPVTLSQNSDASKNE